MSIYFFVNKIERLDTLVIKTHPADALIIKIQLPVTGPVYQLSPVDYSEAVAKLCQCREINFVFFCFIIHVTNVIFSFI